MAWKNFSTGDCVVERSPHKEEVAPKEVRTPKNHQKGNLVALVGEISNGIISRSGRFEHMEKLYSLDDGVLGYNLDGKRVLVKYHQNERQFDIYVALPFVKGVTERKTGRTLLILGSNAHHGEAMQGQFEGVVWKPGDEDAKRYGDTIRWIDIGDKENGFIGIDYNPSSEVHHGVARSPEDVRFLATTLLEFGFDPKKKLFVLQPPYIVERVEGKNWRKNGLNTLFDYAKKEIK